MHLFRTNDSTTRNCLLNTTDHTDIIRVSLVGVVGTAITTVSIIENVLLFYVFSTSRKLRRQNYANPVLLAFFDSVVSICYMLTVSVNMLAYTLENETLVRVWSNYMRVTYCIQHFALTVANFLLVVASLERYLANGPLLRQTFQKRLLIVMVGNKPLVIGLIFALALLFKGTLYFETDLMEVDCESPLELLHPVWLGDALDVDSMAWDGAALRFWTRKICTIILPFLVLAFCNAHIVLHLRRKRRKSQRQFRCNFVHQPQPPIGVVIPVQYQSAARRTSMRKNHSRSSSDPSRPFRGSFIMRQRYSEKKGVRVATRTLVMVVGCYLISNSMCTFMNIWEYLYPTFFRYDHYYAYLLMSDFATLLLICGCALRLPIYVVNDHRIRNAIFRAILRFRYCLSTTADLSGENLEKWSIILVSNSIRSNITGIPANDHRDKKSFDQLALLVQNRRKFLVQMTVNFGGLREMNRLEDGSIDFTTYLTEIAEEHTEACESSRRLLQAPPLCETQRSSSLRKNSYRSVAKFEPVDEDT